MRGWGGGGIRINIINLLKLANLLQSDYLFISFSKEQNIGVHIIICLIVHWIHKKWTLKEYSCSEKFP